MTRCNVTTIYPQLLRDGCPSPTRSQPLRRSPPPVHEPIHHSPHAHPNLLETVPSLHHEQRLQPQPGYGLSHLRIRLQGNLEFRQGVVNEGVHAERNEQDVGLPVGNALSGCGEGAKVLFVGCVEREREVEVRAEAGAGAALGGGAGEVCDTCTAEAAQFENLLFRLWLEEAGEKMVETDKDNPGSHAS